MTAAWAEGWLRPWQFSEFYQSLESFICLNLSKLEFAFWYIYWLVWESWLILKEKLLFYAGNRRRKKATISDLNLIGKTFCFRCIHLMFNESPFYLYRLLLDQPLVIGIKVRQPLNRSSMAPAPPTWRPCTTHGWQIPALYMRWVFIMLFLFPKPS